MVNMEHTRTSIAQNFRCENRNAPAIIFHTRHYEGITWPLAPETSLGKGRGTAHPVCVHSLEIEGVAEKVDCRGSILNQIFWMQFAL